MKNKILNYILICLTLLIGIGVNAADIELVNGNMVLSYDNVSSQYTIQRAEGRLGSYSTIATVTSNTYTDVAIAGNPYDYYYQIFDSDNNLIETLSLELELFGPNMYIYRPQDDPIAIRDFVNGVGDAMQYGEFSPNRYAFYFMPGDYVDAEKLTISFYTHIGGLGKLPYDTRISNLITPPNLPDNNATQTFWRSAENFDVVGVSDGDAWSWMQWAVSQAAPLRRIHSERKAHYQYWYGGWCSGGFTSDCHFEDAAGSYSQQQWYFRNSYVEKGSEGYSAGGWNLAYQGVEFGAGVDMSLHSDNWETSGGAWNNVSRVETTPIIREKPFLFFDETENRFKVFKPGLRHNSTGTSWGINNAGTGTTYDLLNDFFVVKPGTTAQEMNAQLSSGKHLFFAPGIYEISEPLHVTHANTIILGTGYATLIPGSSNPSTAILIDDVDGVSVASLLFDAYYSSRTMVQVGPANASADHSANPTVLSDLFFRVGGFLESDVNVDIALEINSNNVIGDHFWIWRADHGAGVGWERNTSKNGLVVNGDNTTIYGLFNEHFQEYQTLWNGEFGELYFLQCETPYDPPSQDAYMSHDGTVKGYSAYKVADDVQHHRASMMGIYDVFVNTGGAEIAIQNSIEIGSSSDVKIHNACNVNISTLGGFNYVINDTIESTFNQNIADRFYVVDYQGKEQVNDTTPYAPVAVIDASRSSGFAPLGVVFDASSSSDRNGDALTYVWNFGDGSSSSTEESVTHTFDNVGTYVVTLTVTDETGLVGRTQKTIEVIDNPGPIARSTKRGLGTGDLSVADLEVMSPGISWWYNWGVQPNAAVIDQYDDLGMDYVPMTWNDYYDETALRAYLDAHPNVQYLLAFNEPNFLTQANMTPAEVAAAWPRLESIAGEYGLKIISPAVNYCGDCVDIPGTDDDSSPWAYLDEFFAECPDCQVDGIAVHNYMGYKDALEWYIGEFKKYNLPIWLTEFCAWDNNPSLTQQREFMIQSVDYLENDPDVERYAWFVGRLDGYPYNGILDYNNSGILTSLGELYVNMPVHNAEIRYSIPGKIEAENYTTMSGIQLEETGDIDGFLNVGQTEPGDYLNYNVSATGGTYPLTLRVASYSGVQNTATILVDGVETATISFNPTGNWQSYTDIEQDITIPSGDYTIQIRIDAGAFNINWFSIGEVVVDENPIAVITTDPTPATGYGPLSVEFSGVESSDPDGDEITSYIWDFGDGGSATGITATHIYNDAGVYTAKLTVSNALSGNSSVEVTVEEAPDRAPIALMSTDVDQGLIDLTVNFDASASYDPDGDAIISYSWDFGDGSTAEGINVQHIYSEVGEFDVVLTVSNELNGQASKIITTYDVHENIALYKPASASGQEGAYNPENAVDGDPNTRWGSDYTTPSWIKIDLQSTYAISSVVLNWERACAESYQILISDVDSDPVTNAGDWTVLATITGMEDAARIDDLQGLNGSGRYIAMVGTNKLHPWGYSLWEFEVYGVEDGGNLTPIADCGGDIVIDEGNCFTLDASESYDPDGSIASYNWTGNGLNSNNSSETICDLTEGTYTYTLVVTDNAGATATCSTVITVNPGLCGTTNIALNKPAAASSQEGGWAPAQAVDNNMGTRWSSLGTDDEWIRIDLEGTYSICEVQLVWETAYGSAYEILLGNSTDINAATTIATVTNSDGGTDIVETDQSVIGSYIWMHGITRATGWGYSLYEIEVYGKDEIIVPVITSIEIDPVEDMILGESQALSATPYDQFGSVMSDITIDWTVGNCSGCIVGDVFTPSAAGEYTISASSGSVSDNVTINVEQIIVPTENLALNKPATSSTEQAGVPTEQANDGDYGTRWSSEWNDNQWWQVDLQDEYEISAVNIYWENAYGQVYDIQISNDPAFSSYQTLYSEINSDGGKDSLPITVTNSGRYLRMNGLTRATGWGFSIFEFEAYGVPTLKSAESFADASPEGSLLIYPNPVENYLSLQWESEIEQGTIKIVDLSGKVVYQKNEYQVLETTISVDQLLPGSYVLICNSGKAVEYKLFIKE